MVPAQPFNLLFESSQSVVSPQPNRPRARARPRARFGNALLISNVVLTDATDILTLCPGLPYQTFEHEHEHEKILAKPGDLLRE